MMKSYSIIFLFFLSGLLSAQSLSYKPGEGIQLKSEKEQWEYNMLGYIQSTYTFHNSHENNTIQNAFYVERARLDFVFNYLKTYQIFFELDAAPNRTALVLAQLDIAYLKNHKMELGKFIVPFSPENMRSSRGLSTVERYSALNSFFLLPAFDAQYGIMFYGTFEPINYYFSVTNGNASAAENSSENNNPKDFQARLEYAATKEFNFGGSINYSTEEEQSLKLVDHTFESFNEANINGRRFGYLGNFEYQKNDFLFRGEIFQFNFLSDLFLENQIKYFSGGYAELGYFLCGNISDGLQLIGRFENAQYHGDIFSLFGPTNLNSFIVGTNWYRDGIFRLQVNLIYEKVDSISLLKGRFEGKDNELELLTMLQLKF